MRALSEIVVWNKEKSVDFILEHGASVARFGDGEIDIIMGNSIPYQAYSKALADDLKQVLQTPSSENLLVCLPDVFQEMDRYNHSAQLFWEKHFEHYKNFYQTELHSAFYGSTFLSRPYIDWVDKSSSKDYFAQLRSLWDNRDVLIVEGSTSRSGMGNDLFANAASVRRIIGPSKNAYQEVEALYQSILEHAQPDTLVLLMLGPTAKVLAYRLSQVGHQAIDLGHIDSEYEWFQRKAQHKIKLEHKHTAEFNKDHHISLETDAQYESEIIAYVGVYQEQQKDLISVVIPVYNAETYLRRCLDSLLSQTYQNIELILVNDGSTDHSAQILEEYAAKDKRLKVVHKPNGGVSSARNLGLELVTGDYITFVDADDFVDESYLETLHRQLKTYQTDIAICNFASFNEERQSFLFFTTKETYFEQVYTPQEWIDQENNSRHNLFLTVLFSVTKLYKASLWKDVRFPLGRVREDDATIYKVYLRAKSISFANTGLYYYSQHADSLSKTVMLEDIATMISNAEERLALMVTLGYDVTEHIDSYVKRLRKCQVDALSAGQMSLYQDISLKLELIDKRSQHGR